ncbi:MAG: dynamin family protein [Actinomycetota bacterium]|nr:dynamin family protein [Actinomycetota bacterium]
MQGPLSRAVAGLCTALLPQVSERTAGGLREVLRRLDTPLQLAVAGRIKAGKSTLVNALIGRRVAPTDVGECTRLVTRFQYGTVDRIEVVMKNGSRTTIAFAPDGGIPSDLAGLGGVDGLDAVSHLEAYLTSALLSDVTVIDTPGLGSMDAASVARTEALLGAKGAASADSAAPADSADPAAETASAAADPGALDQVSEFAVAGAEAIVYVFTQSVRSDDTKVLAAFTAATASRDAGPVNALAVLNKADTVQPDDVEQTAGGTRATESSDAIWKAAERLARSQAAVLRPRVADVLPMNGLLAETAETGAFTSSDAEALRALAGVDEALFGAMMMAGDLFTSLEAPVDSPTRVRLLQLLDLYGIRQAVEIVRAEPTVSAGELRRRLLARSGLEEFRRRLGEVFRLRSDGIKASAALASIGALAASTADPHERQRVHDGIEMLLQRPEAHQLRLLEALTLVSSGAVAMDAELTAEILRLGGSTRPDEQLGLVGRRGAELQAAALERAGWWRSFASFGATPGQSRVAHVVHRAYFLLWQQLKGQLPSGPPGLASR